ncbi:MAG: cell division protein ZapA [Sphingorhabdus sp.]|nr:cell division protein ZapA [Sphingorhabdus sp.]
MAEVRLNIVGREYIVTCRDGEEQRLLDLGAMVDSKAREAGGSAGGLNESRQLLFAALLLADQLNEANGGVAMVPANKAIDEQTAVKMVQSLEKLAERVESFASGLEQASQDA